MKKMTRERAIALRRCNEGVAQAVNMSACALAAGGALIMAMEAALPRLFDAPQNPIMFSATLIALLAVMGALVTDLRSRRIPNDMSLVILGAGIMWSFAESAGESMDMSWASALSLLPIPTSTPDIIEPLGAFGRIMADGVAMAMVFSFLFACFAFGLGIGGGDVKVISALAFFFGWPMGLSAFLSIFIVGGVLSLGLVAVKTIIVSMALYGEQDGFFGRIAGEMVRMKEIPFAVPIAMGSAPYFYFLIKGAL